MYDYVSCGVQTGGRLVSLTKLESGLGANLDLFWDIVYVSAVFNRFHATYAVVVEMAQNQL